jgi:hypothetical protein
MSRTVRLTRALVPLVSACLVIVGCGTKAPPGTVPVSGSVTLSGKPLPTGTVHFSTADRGRSSAIRVSGGSFATHLVPADYAVAVTADAQPERVDEATGTLIPPQRLVPERYMSPKTSGLKAPIDVKAREVTLTLELVP